MNFIPLSEHEMTMSFFEGVYYAVWNVDKHHEEFHFLGGDGKWYVSKRSAKLEIFFPVIKNLNWAMHGWEDWTWYYMGKRKGGIFVHEYILKKYKKYAGIKDKFMEHTPNYDAAEKALEKALEKFKLEKVKDVLYGRPIDYVEIDDEYIDEYINYIPTEEDIQRLRIIRVNVAISELEALGKTLEKFKLEKVRDVLRGRQVDYDEIDEEYIEEYIDYIPTEEDIQRLRIIRVDIAISVL